MFFERGFYIVFDKKLVKLKIFNCKIGRFRIKCGIIVLYRKFEYIGGNYGIYL